jgi:hypothetical protein
MRLARFVASHWRGQNEPLVALLIGGLVMPFIAAGLISLADLLVQLSAEDLRTIAVTAFGKAALTAAVLLWAMIGVVRTYARRGLAKGAFAFASVLGLVAAVALLRGPAWTEAAREHWSLARGVDPMGAPASLSVEHGELRITGPLSHGSADRLERLLRSGADIDAVVLDSLGGRLLEADRMAGLIRAAGLDTIVDGDCLSACITLLLAGRERCALQGSAIGFHQATAAGYDRLDEALVGTEQEATLIAAGVEKSFAKRAAETPNEDMWVPSEAELLAAGVLTHGHEEKERAAPGLAGRSLKTRLAGNQGGR